jgi:hypothetical protein
MNKTQATVSTNQGLKKALLIGINYIEEPIYCGILEKY